MLNASENTGSVLNENQQISALSWGYRRSGATDEYTRRFKQF
jgi:hypothetical protein